MENKKGFIVTLLSGLLLFSVMFPVVADEKSQSEQQLQEVSRQIQRKQQELNQTKQAEKNVTGQIVNIERNIAQTEQELQEVAERLTFLKNNIAKQEKEITIAEKELEKQTEILNERLVFVYEQGDTTFLEVLLNATDIKDFLTRYDWLSSIIDQDKELIKSIHSQKKKLEAYRQQMQAQAQELEAVKNSEQEKKTLLASQKEDKQKNLSRIQAEKGEYERALQELEETSRQLESIISKYQSGNSGAVAGASGVMGWPARGSITSPYGMRYHPVLKVRKLHTGIDIGASMGANIAAADGGTVISTGWMGGYGQVVIIDHGKGISTLYAHQSKILVSNGQKVSKGQTIGKVGSTGWSTGPHLHFEVRINGQPTDPMNYLK